jgi:long-chain acyl-CoA synthetase
MIALANSQKLNSLEKPKQLTLLKEPFTDQNGYLTPTMKLKRNVAKEMLKDKIAEMYAKTPMAPSKK